MKNVMVKFCENGDVFVWFGKRVVWSPYGAEDTWDHDHQEDQFGFLIFGESLVAVAVSLLSAKKEFEMGGTWLLQLSTADKMLLPIKKKEDVCEEHS